MATKKANSAFMKPMTISEELAVVLAKGAISQGLHGVLQRV
jgi:hypothetical protein